MIEPVEALTAGFAKLRQSEVLSDCKIICGPYHFNLHKAVLGSQSEYFMTVFKNDTFKEGQSGVIELKAIQNDDPDEDDEACDDPEIVRLMVEYFYHFDYLRDTGATSATSTTTSETRLVEHTKVFAMAIKYQVDGLRDLAVSKFKMAAGEYWKHDDFASAIVMVYESTADDVLQLRGVVADILDKHISILHANAQVESAIKSIDGLAYAVLKRKLSEPKPTRKLCDCEDEVGTCDNCMASAVALVGIQCPRCSQTIDKLSPLYSPVR